MTVLGTMYLVDVSLPLSLSRSLYLSFSLFHSLSLFLEAGSVVNCRLLGRGCISHRSSYVLSFISLNFPLFKVILKQNFYHSQLCLILSLSLSFSLGMCVYVYVRVRMRVFVHVYVYTNS